MGTVSIRDLPLAASFLRRSWRSMVQALLLAASCLVLLAGCGPKGLETVPVRGAITFGGGEWPKPGVANFTPVEAAPGFPLRPAGGAFDVDGRLTVTSFSRGDGLVPGKYRVGIECWEVPPSMDRSQIPKSFLPAKYQSPVTSGLEVVVEPGARVVEVRFDIPKQ